MKRLLKVPILCARSPLGRSFIVGMALVLTRVWAADAVRAQTAPRERISLNADWRFIEYASREEADDLIYDARVWCTYYPIASASDFWTCVAT